jgi:oligopeptide transport system ATP-binding protein
MSDNPPILTVKDLKTRFHTPEGTVYAVNDVSFHVSEGETLAVVGESGCGKSVTMLSILRLIAIPPGEIVSGEVIYHNSNLLKLSEEEMEKVRGKEIAMVFQDPMTSLNPVLSIGRQITETLRTHTQMDPQQTRVRAVELLNWVGIPDAQNRLGDFPHQFSGGMRQRVMIAMALACSPGLLIADEPTTALDVTIQAQIIELVKRLKQELGMAIIWITHDLGVVAGMADRVLVMYAGFIAEEAEVFELYENPLHPYTLALIAALPRADLRRAHSLKSIRGAPPNLLVEPRGCPFAPRCEYVQEKCIQQNPALREVAPGHKIACWMDVKTGAQR